MITLLSALVSLLSFRVRSRASLELELVALRHQVTVLRRQRPGQLRLFSADRLLWVWLYRIWPQVLNAMVLVKPATVVQWHRKGFQLYWRWRSRRLGRPRASTEIRDLIRQMSLANPLWGAPASTASCSSSASRSAKPRSGDVCRGGPKPPPRPGVAFCTTISPTLRRSTCSLLQPRRHCDDRHVRCCNRDVSSSLCPDRPRT